MAKRLKAAYRNRFETKKCSTFTFIDLFAGIGGIRLGFEAVGGKCVFTSEYNKFAQQTYRANFTQDKHEIAGDIRDVSTKDIPEHDVLVAGFPCQPFSIAGVSSRKALGQPHGFACEKQGNLFFEIERILRDCRPKAFLLENVKNLVKHDGGFTFAVIMHTLRNLGYYVPSPCIINARGYVPQNRERIIIVGFRERCEFSFDDLYIPSPQDGPKLHTILHPEDGTEEPELPYTLPDGSVNPKYILSDRLWQYLKNRAAELRVRGCNFGFSLVDNSGVARALLARYHKDGSDILVNRGKGANPRRLTPRECARLMGFDKPGESRFRIVVSDSQAYKQFGNSVVVPMIEAVARHMLPHILR